ncbi:hypothetical protein [Anaerosporobacter sp.]|uniref:hypothetical protein n=1 Tax=Anaerosporobacter sp. TaxID=1872529 RepID=UPI00286F3238|nr:hypothetical protein [Anaerosporobacter sp.]
MNSNNEFIGYEYKEFICKKQMQPLYEDCIKNFGWLPEGSEAVIGKPDAVSLKFKRDRKITNKAELVRLQRQFEACIRDIVSLEKNKTTKASTIAYIIGVIGTSFMAGSVFAVTSENILLCILLAVPGALGWVIPYGVFCKIKTKKVKKLNPLIEQKYDEVFGVCEKANTLLN